MNSETLYSLNKNYAVSGYRNSTCSHGFDPLTGNALSSRARGICRSFVSLPYENCNWIKPVQLKNISISDRQPLQPRHTTINRTRANYKSEEYDVTGTDLDSLISSEGGASEAILVGETKPWWEEFPKRWVIVLLCFSAFLLCNMDRVNMSIAILPMSKEFNWNSATVGLIQSSFFWGYLLTQVKFNEHLALQFLFSNPDSSIQGNCS
nr:ascorbate transporter, chloroplastic [Tanacetum cinerariifolium]GEY98064.1 ascorbate transporter, chloroplastic [Tanacetum cinerariifolium]